MEVRSGGPGLVPRLPLHDMVQIPGPRMMRSRLFNRHMFPWMRVQRPLHATGACSLHYNVTVKWLSLLWFANWAPPRDMRAPALWSGR